MRKLYLANGNSKFKFSDTTTKIILTAFDNGIPVELTSNSKVRVKNDSGYLLDVSASIMNGQATITSGQLAQLPAGRYLLELWDTVSGGTAIYPSDGFLALQINENVTGLSGKVVSSITVDDFIEQFSSLSQQLKKQVSDAVGNGLKGDKGADGQTTYVHFAYANSADGKTDFNVSYFDNALYIGTYTDFVQADSGDYTKYTWSRLKGDTGPQGDRGPQGPKGDKGKDAVINVITQAEYDKLSDKSGVYFIEG